MNTTDGGGSININNNNNNNNNNTSSMMMGFGSENFSHNHNNNNIMRMMMMPPSSSSCNPNPNSNNNNNNNNNIFLPLTTNNNNNNQNSSNSIYFMENFNNNNNCSSLKSKIMSHPHYPRLITAYINCQKIGAPDEVIVRLEQACGTEIAAAARQHQQQQHQENINNNSSCLVMLGDDPALDQFMEAYCEMLNKYEQELSKPFKEAMLFLNTIESQFKSLSFHSAAMDRNGSSDEEIDVNTNFVDPLAEDKELKGQLLRKYSGYLGSLKHEFMKKRKKGKLPKEARQQLLDWWSQHYKWPYPSETQKLALAQSTGLDQKQINNWFINQRKRHWKPSEDMQFVMMDASAHAHPHPHHYYMDTILPSNPFPMDVTPAGFL